MKNASPVDASCKESSVKQSVSSDMGPKTLSARQMMVQLGHSVSDLRTLNS